MDVCGDNRFEIIEKAKKALIDSTNIGQSWDEMEVLDDFLFRCWQMGWLDKYDTTKYISEKECGDCDIWKRLKWYESQDLISREDVDNILYDEPIMGVDGPCYGLNKPSINTIKERLANVSKAEPPRENE